MPVSQKSSLLARCTCPIRFRFQHAHTSQQDCLEQLAWRAPVGWQELPHRVTRRTWKQHNRRCNLCLHGPPESPACVCRLCTCTMLIFASSLHCEALQDWTLSCQSVHRLQDTCRFLSIQQDKRCAVHALGAKVNRRWAVAGDLRWAPASPMLQMLRRRLCPLPTCIPLSVPLGMTLCEAHPIGVV